MVERPGRVTGSHPVRRVQQHEVDGDLARDPRHGVVGGTTRFRRCVGVGDQQHPVGLAEAALRPRAMAPLAHVDDVAVVHLEHLQPCHQLTVETRIVVRGEPASW